ncbi:MAG: flagellar export protein FliJ [Spirochaetes bacterium]|nr:flagellar export protein FliJ [Spirochaetota bacterium]
MKKFKFRLQKLLDARIAKEKDIQHELSVIVTKQNVFRIRQDELRRKVGEQRVVFSDAMKKKSVNPAELLNFHKYWDFAEKAILSAQSEIDKLEPAVNEVRVRLTEAVKERKTIEKFKERKFEEWKNMLKKAEEKEYDDINQKVYMRKVYLNEEEIPEGEAVYD